VRGEHQEDHVVDDLVHVEHGPGLRGGVRQPRQQVRTQLLLSALDDQVPEDSLQELPPPRSSVERSSRYPGSQGREGGAHGVGEGGADGTGLRVE